MFAFLKAIRGLLLVLLAFASTIGASWSQQGGTALTLTGQQLNALSPLMCPACVNSKEVLVQVYLPTMSFVAAKESDITGGSILLVEQSVVASAAHVCMGRTVLTGSSRPVFSLPADRTPRVSYDLNREPEYPYGQHPSNFGGVCIGELVHVTEFLKSIVGAVFADQLQKFESATSEAEVERVVRSNLAGALELQKTELADGIKRDVVMELRGVSPVSREATPPSSQASRTCRVVAACEGKSEPTQKCCQCYTDRWEVGACNSEGPNWSFKGAQ